MSAWNDFNDAEQQQSFDLIPKGTVAPVRMTIKPGGHDDAAQGWTGGYATQSFETGSIFLACEFVILDGEYARRKMWSNVGLHSSKGPAWGNMGRTFIRAVLNSSRNISPQDNSAQAAASRRIQGFHELDGIEFMARIDVEKDGRGELRNVVKIAVEPDHPDYARDWHCCASGTHRAHPDRTGRSTDRCAAGPASRRAGQTGLGAVRGMREMLGLQTTGSGVRPHGQPSWHRQPRALPDRLGLLFTPVSGRVSRAVRQLGACDGRQQGHQGGQSDRSL